MNVQKLLVHLESGNDRQRRAASYRLGQLKDPTAVPHLIRAYNDVDPGVRENVIDALRIIGTREALDFLAQAQLDAIRTSNHRLVRLVKIAKDAAWLLVGGGMLAGIATFGVSFAYSGLNVYFLGLFSMVGLVSGLVLRLLAEATHVVIGIEANTRRAAEASEKLLDLQASLNEEGFSSREKPAE